VAEAQTADIYERVYRAERPELFFKATGSRAVGPGGQIRIRRDSAWNVPEPELALVANAAGEIIGYTAGNDVSSRSIEAENPLYLPQAKIYTGSCALGPGIELCSPQGLRQLPVQLSILRGDQQLFSGETSIGNMKRSPEDLLAYLYRELDFPHGAYLLTGTGIVPPDDFSLQPGDRVAVKVGDLSLENQVV
jgi:2-dehydro-3-deoxy-D-arabinonate dehydratase